MLCSHDQRSVDSCQSTEVKALPRCLRIVREHVCLSYRFTDEGHTKAVGFITQHRYLTGTFDILLSTTASTQPSVRCCGPIRGSAPHALPFCARTSRHGEVRKASTYLAVGATAIWRQSEDARGIFWAVRCVMLLDLAGLELAPDPRAWVGLSALVTIRFGCPR